MLKDEENMKYRKKPVEIEAVKFLGYPSNNSFDHIPEWLKESFGREVLFFGEPNTLTIKTLEGDHLALEGDYIIRGVKGELYPCKPDIFEMTYEKVE